MRSNARYIPDEENGAVGQNILPPQKENLNSQLRRHFKRRTNSGTPNLTILWQFFSVKKDMIFAIAFCLGTWILILLLVLEAI